MTKKVLIISYHFPPVNNIAARRFSELIPFLKQLGWEPYVLTTNSEGSLPTHLDEEFIFRFGDHPDSKAIAYISEKKPSLINAFRMKHGLALRTVDSTYKSWYLKHLRNKQLIEQLQQHHFDLIITSFAPSACLWAGAYFSKQLNVPFIADFRDLAALHIDDCIQINHCIRLIDMQIEKYLLKNCATITTVSSGLANEITKLHNKTAHVIYNGWYNTPSTTDVTKPSGLEQDYVFYAGRFYNGRLDAVFLLLNALKFSNLSFVARSLGPENLENEILAYATEIGVKDQVRLLPPITPNELLAEQVNAKANLVFEELDKSVAYKRGVLTGKFLQLLTFKPPVLCIARDDSEIGDVLHETNRGALASNATEVQSFLQSLQQANAYPLDLTKLQKYSKQEQAKKLVNLVENFGFQ